MLFDEKDLNVFSNSESRTYFKEILQSYYSQNYRATVVMLYSFVIYDLFMKLQTMANEGDSKAIQKLAEINIMIADDEKYSKVENEVIRFYTETCPLYFNRFIEDIEYLKNCRNKCAHLKVNDNSLYVPSDYHARMLICSMFDNIFSVKAPFIMDLFSIVESDVETYSSDITYIPCDGLNDAIKKEIKDKYLSRMTYDSIKKSFRTFIKLLFISKDENCEKNAYGLYAFVYALTDYIIKKGLIQIFSEENIIDIFSKIEPDLLKNSAPRRNALASIMIDFSVVMDLIRENESLFNYISECILLKPTGIYLYRVFYPRAEKSTYAFFTENESIQKPSYTEKLYTLLKDCDDFKVDEFMKIMVTQIPTWSGFDAADSFMDSLKSHIQELSIDTIKEILQIYRRNPQCINRGRHLADIAEVNKYIADHNDNSDEDSESSVTTSDD